MGYIDSYLAQVGRYLPNAQRDDILSELRSSVEDQAQDIAGTNPPGPEDEKAVLIRLGHPLKVASGYAGPRYLIGPELFPSFTQTLQRVLYLVALIQLAIIAIAYVTSGYTTSVIGLFAGVFDTLLWATIVVVAVFAIIEYSGDQLNWYDNWTPDSLSLVKIAQIKRGDLITNLVSEAVFLLWWNDILVLQNWLPGAGEVLKVSLGPAWAALHLPLNVLFAAWFALHALVLLRGVWRPLTLWIEIGLGLFSLALAGWLLTQSPLSIVSGDVGPSAARITEQVMIWAIVFFGATVLWDIWLAVRRLRETQMP